MKPIIMSTEDVRAILDGRKTMTRLAIKPQPVLIGMTGWPTPILHIPKKGPLFPGSSDHTSVDVRWRFAPYKPGDVLWVRETFAQIRCIETGNVYTFYAANELDYYTVMTTYQRDDNGFETDRHIPWRNGIHMPQDAARLFLRVKDVRVERVQDITAEDALREGCTGIPCEQCAGGYFRGCTDCMNSGWQEPPQLEFSQRWDARNAKHGYGWDSNLWTWVYTFERITKEEAEHGH